MTALVIVDGFNALGARPDGWWRDRPAAMTALVGRLESYAREQGVAVAVVFDGRRHDRVAAASAAVEVSFAGPGRNAADREIARMVREDESPERVLVVSSDRRLQAAVKAAGGSSVGAGRFGAEQLSGERPGGAADSGPGRK